MVLAHDDDLMTIEGIGHGTVGGLLNGRYAVLLILAVTGSPRTRRDNGSPSEVPHRDTESFVW